MDNQQKALRIRSAFKPKVKLILGVPAGVFYSGLVIATLTGFLTRSFFLSFLILAAYHIFMTVVHKKDPKALSIWIACGFSSDTALTASDPTELDIKIVE